MSAPLPRGTRLAVPPMHPEIPDHIRREVLALVERRLFGEAVDLALDAEEARRRRGSSTFASIHALMSATPHKNARGYRAAA